MSKYKALFIEQSREHLATLSACFVRLEAAVEPGPIIDEIFRHAHSIKGMAASMHYEPIVALAHHMEDIMSAVRDRKLELAADLIDLLLKAVDALVAQVEQVSGDTLIAAHDDLVEALREALPTSAQEPAAAVVKGAPPSPKKRGKGAAGRRILVTLDPGCKAASVRLFLVHRKLSEMGKVLESIPPADAMRRGEVSDLKAEMMFDGAPSEAVLSEVLLALPEVQSVAFDAVPAEPERKSGRRSKKTAAVAPAEPVEPAKSNTVRVRTDTLDTLIDRVGELFLLRDRLDSLLAGFVPAEVRNTLDQLARRIREIHNQVLTVRMMPMRTLTDRYPRLVRDLSRSLDKDVELEIQGSDIELDRAILDGLDEPLMHTLRNAIDHGIEDSETRGKSGKPHKGRVTLSASRDRDAVVVVVEDDGKGLDPERLKERALRQGLIAPHQAEQMSVREAHFLICLPGFSTKTEVNGVSGRGVGMDVVRDKIEGLGGTLDIDSEVGRRTAFILRLPLTLAIVNVLFVEAAKRVFALPVAKVVAVREMGENTIREAGGTVYLSFRHALVPAYALADLLGIKTPARAEQAVVIEDGRDLVAVAVERVVGSQEVVVKPLGEPLDRMEWFAGAAIVGDGQPILILDLPKALRSRWAA